jgi:hypothetical protein
MAGLVAREASAAERLLSSPDPGSYPGYAAFGPPHGRIADENAVGVESNSLVQLGYSGT